MTEFAKGTQELVERLRHQLERQQLRASCFLFLIALHSSDLAKKNENNKQTVVFPTGLSKVDPGPFPS